MAASAGLCCAFPNAIYLPDGGFAPKLAIVRFAPTDSTSHDCSCCAAKEAAESEDEENPEDQEPAKDFEEKPAVEHYTGCGVEIPAGGKQLCGTGCPGLELQLNA